ncbi:MAG: hypothetical protein L0Z52_13075, partial [Acidobacteria bacterium]|nr:hypothetical protein [Acidobacteriota bacterium]
ESIEERILQLHVTKRNVLANVWAKEGKDVIAAPGGSGAFREMVGSLLRQIPPAGGPAERAPGPPAAAAPTSPPAPAQAAALRADEGGKSRLAAPVPPGLADAGAAGFVPNPGVLAAAVAAVAPAVPQDHRRSLAAVFRALAEALEGSTSDASSVSEFPSPTAGLLALGPLREA